MKCAGLLCGVVFCLNAQNAPKQRAEAEIVGIVVGDFDGRAIAGVTVALRTAGTGVPIQETRTDEVGQFAFKKVARGRYELMATYQDAQPARYPAPIVVGPGHSAKPIVFKLVQRAVISGGVVDAEGQPVQDAFVRALRADYRRNRLEYSSAGLAKTDDAGEFRLTIAPSDSVFLMASPPERGLAVPAQQNPSNRQYVASFHPGVTDISQAVAVTAAPGRENGPFRIQLAIADVVPVSGRVAGLDARAGAAPPGIALAGAEDQRPSAAAWLHGEAFELAATPGSYVLSVTDRNLSVVARQRIEAE